MKRNIIANTKASVCNGEIEILNKDERTAYVKWVIYDQDNKLVASLTNSYFLRNGLLNDSEIFSLVKKAILKYRIGRETIFSSVEFL